MADNEQAMRDLETTLAFLRNAVRNRSPFTSGKEHEFNVVADALLKMRMEWGDRERLLMRRPDAD